MFIPWLVRRVGLIVHVNNSRCVRIIAYRPKTFVGTIKSSGGLRSLERGNGDMDKTCRNIKAHIIRFQPLCRDPMLSGVQRGHQAICVPWKVGKVSGGGARDTVSIVQNWPSDSDNQV